ncbi:MAG: hypothetical protein KDA88_20615 [Planctomycetaceae bacterium]|nr:hypothetical protein [Planctomycetaceae bacterium]
MTDDVEVLNSTPLLWCGLALVAWGGIACCQRFVLSVSIGRLAHGPRLGLAFATWFFAIATLTQVMETASDWPHWLIALSAAIASEAVFFCYQTDTSFRTTSSGKNVIQPLLPLLRVAMIALLSVLLLEPVLTHEEEHEEEHAVAVIVDVSDSMDLRARLDNDPDRSRIQVAQQLLGGDSTTSNGLQARLERDYDVKLYELGASAREVEGKQHSQRPLRQAGSSDWTKSTDFADAMRQVRGDIPAAQLSGVLMISDGRDHSSTDINIQCQPLGNQGVPVNSVVIGSRKPLKDGQIVSILAPSQIYHGDSVSLTASLKADQYMGETATVRLFDGEDFIEEKSIVITGEQHRESVTFSHQPEEPRIHEYRVELAGLPNEESTENNQLVKPVWVSQDRIRVLLIDQRPRWEFRYLRNLFAGRDQSVFLQVVLLQGDRLAGVPAPPTMRASAQRAFDDCEANALPLDESEWFKFDVIVIGDVSPQELGNEGIQTLERFVKDRGGALVVIAGPNHMPHAYRATPLADVLPVLMSRAAIATARSPDQSFHFSLTQEGVSDAVLQRATGTPSPSFPELTWRHPDCEAKAGARVLAYASPKPERPHDAETDAARQRQQALMLWHRYGTGKVLQLNFDETWRLRYGIGDRLHHEFWGQIIRWSVSERLSAGTDLVRLGTDQTLYKSGEAISVQARLLNEDRSPVMDSPVQAKVLFDNEVAQTIDLKPDPQNIGMLHGEIRDLTQSGKYRIELSGEVVDELLALEAAGTRMVGLEVGVEAAAENLEQLDLVADDTILKQIADWTGGVVVDLADVDSALLNLGPKSTFVRERWTVPLWNLWPVIGFFLGGLSLEWVLRKWTGRI